MSQNIASENITKEQKIQYCRKNTAALMIEDLRNIGRMIDRSSETSKLIESPDGIRVDMSKLSDNLVDNIYKFIKDKVEKPSQHF